ncbi:MAG: hypothetical protein WCP70_09685 [Methanothrix sp.]
MFPQLWDPLLEDAAHEWYARIFSPAFVFWAGGVLAYYASSTPKVDIIASFNGLGFEMKLALAVTCIIILAASINLMEWLQLPLLRFLEGYWSSILDPLKDFLIRHKKAQLKSMEKMRNDLSSRYDELESHEIKEYNRLDSYLSMYPLDKFYLLPTNFGNILCSAEEYCLARYGLEPVTVWPRMWLILPESTKNELQSARQDINEKASLFGWSLIFSIWVIWSWWAVILSVLGMVIVYRLGLLPAAAIYGDLLRSSFDLHRFALYETLRLPLPADPFNEKKDGQGVTQFLRRGMHPDPKLQFQHMQPRPKQPRPKV